MKMNGKVLFCILVLSQKSLAQSMFYHEPSYVVFQPKKDFNETADFGFSMGYQHGAPSRLVVGAPHANAMGEVYSCPLEPGLKKTVCEKLPIDVKDYDENDKSRNFCLGATIATTDNYFMTCAPLWTTTGVKSCINDDKLVCKPNSGAYGTCYVYYNQTSHRFKGILEQNKDVEEINKPYGAIYGGVGWSLLADATNSLLLLAKPFKTGDIQYVNSSGLERDHERGSSSLYYSPLRSSYAAYFSRMSLTNIGYAMAAGRFFSNHTSYAFSMKDNNAIGVVNFLNYQRNQMKIQQIRNVKLAKLMSGKPGDMYGVAMSAADVDSDGSTDLLVGAPAHSEQAITETGALYIHLGGSAEKMGSLEKRRVILGEKAYSRFGSAIATSDVDGDSLPEILVSAPYEASGVLYILSGYEVNHKVIKRPPSKGNVKLSELKETQKIMNIEFNSFGFSLNVIPNVNGNGCDDLALGSPRSNRVVVLRCIPSINATLTAKRLEEVVKTSDNKFTVQVCVKVSYPNKPEYISTKLQVVSEVIGKGATLLKDEFDVDLSLRYESYCENVTVQMRPDEKQIYYYFAKLKYKHEGIFKSKAFDSTWVRLSIHSKLEAKETVTRACAETDCTPDLRMDILWAGSKHPKDYRVDEKTNENVTLLITNKGASAYDACVRIRVTGAKEQIPCPIDNNEQYMCRLPKSLPRNTTHSLKFLVSIEKATNVDDTVHITADLYTDCSSPNVTQHEELQVKFIFAMKKVYILENSHNVTVTDRQLLNNQTQPTLIDKHEYKIVNNGSLYWENFGAIINLRYRDYIQSCVVSIKDYDKGCEQNNELDGFVKFVCTGMKLYDKPILIYVRTEISYNKLRDHFDDGHLDIESNITVTMASIVDNSKNFLGKSQKTTIWFVKETSLGNNKTAIIIIVLLVAFLILGCIVWICYKVGFFQRTEKERLDSFKASVKNTIPDAGDKPITAEEGELDPDSKEDNMEDFEIEVIDDCPFDLEPLTTDDDAKLLTDDTDEPSTSQAPSRSASARFSKRTSKKDPSNPHTVACDGDVLDDIKQSPGKEKARDRHSTKL